jgi:hypothetical protein
MAESFVSYRPIDEQLDTPKIRLLRALRHFTWISVSELLQIMGESYDYTVINRYSQAMLRLAQRGLVDTDDTFSQHYLRYAINLKGLRELRRINRRGRVFFPPQMRL